MFRLSSHRSCYWCSPEDECHLNKQRTFSSHRREMVFRPHLMTNKLTTVAFVVLFSILSTVRAHRRHLFFYFNFFFCQMCEKPQAFDLTVLDRVAFWMLSIIHAFNMFLFPPLRFFEPFNFFSPYIIFPCAAFFCSIERLWCCIRKKATHTTG